MFARLTLPPGAPAEVSTARTGSLLWICINMES